MTRDDLSTFLKIENIEAVWFEYFYPYPAIKIFCSDGDFDKIDNFFKSNLPMCVGREIVFKSYYRTFTLPKSTIHDHLRDCFGWAMPC